jgi:SlyX protein
MPDPDARITELEIALAHQERVAEDLSDVVREQADRLALLERRLAAIAERVAALEARPDALPAERRPPHW